MKFLSPQGFQPLHGAWRSRMVRHDPSWCVAITLGASSHHRCLQ
ncbi:hypothetical protein [Nostoc sp.]